MNELLSSFRIHTTTENSDVPFAWWQTWSESEKMARKEDGIPTGTLWEVRRVSDLGKQGDTEGNRTGELKCSHCNPALKRPYLLKTSSHLSRPEHLRRQNKVRSLQIGSSLTLTWPVSIAGVFHFEVTRLHFLFVYAVNYVSAQAIFGYGVGFWGHGWEAGGKVEKVTEKESKGLFNQWTAILQISIWTILGIAAQTIHLIFRPLSKEKAEPNTVLKINICQGRASRILLNASCVRIGIPKTLGMHVAAGHRPTASTCPVAINYP